MDRVRNFTDSDLSQVEKSGIRLLVSKKVLDPAVWTLENFTNEELLKVCKDALREQQGEYHDVIQPYPCTIDNFML